MRKAKIILPVVWALLISCAVSHHHQTKNNLYADTCTKTDNYGTIDAYEVINVNNKTTFKAAEYINCEDGRNIVVITWEGTHDTKNANLAAQVMTKFFGHFHAGENISYLLVPEESGENVFVYRFEPYTPRRTILSF
tara:strand:+ start:366 stop:776 length:411 start_codon:yes stop_codon:yes gene_type:complete